ncbi:MAG: alpha/beta fold hydrolase [Chloroflexaceae bacterium]|jgi:haloalkane dehalogenase|nr:alpha/beta fold hydrolase [Chloroflexaceae bacterium]
MNDTSWIDRTAYPFAPHYFEIDGTRMHYVDKGQGEPIVLLHGTPTWSFLYRDAIKVLAPRYRCIAPDHLGFGLSDKPEGAAYHPREHARRLRALIEQLGLRDITLVVQDFGGPIGLSYAIEQPDNVRALVVANTWLWSLRGELLPELAGRVAGSQLGRFFFRQFNIEVRTLFRAVWADKRKLSRTIYQHYLKPFSRPGDTQGQWVFARELLFASDWYESLWARRDRIKDIPALLLWGEQDMLFKARHLDRWQALFTNVQTVTFPNAGHYVQEEAHERFGPLIGKFLARRLEEVS